MANSKSFILYKIWYGNELVYVGRTKQPLQTRLRGHFFKKPMHRSININLVTKVEYAIFQTEADMNVYEIYFINLWKPTLNIDDKCFDELTVSLPNVEWNEFTTHLWDKWKQEINAIDNACRMKKNEQQAKLEMDRLMRQKWCNGEITEDDYYNYLETENEIKEEIYLDSLLQ